MYCSKCGTQIGDNASFCYKCGERTSVSQLNVNNMSPVYTPQPARKENGYYETPLEMSEKCYPMNWYKFLVYFLLFATGLGYFLLALCFFISGAHYGEYAGRIYHIVDDLQTLDIITGILCIVIAIYTLYVRSQLTSFKKDAPKRLVILYILPIILAVFYYIVLYNIALSVASNSSKVAILFSLLLNGVTVPIICQICMIIINYIYFKNRKSLFVN